MKDTCVVQINAYDGSVRFSPDTGGAAYLSDWPSPLRKKFCSDGVYAIRRVRKSTPRALHVVIVGQRSTVMEGLPAKFAVGSYSICSKFLRKLGVTPPPEGKRKSLHLVVTKRRSK